MTTRTVAGVTQTLTWDEVSNLTSVTPSTGAATTYLYDASGQRYAAITGTTATVYMGSWEATDPNTGDSSSADVKLTRFYSADGAQLGSKTTGGSLLVTLGDVQGSAQVSVDSAGVTTTNSYTPYGTKRATATPIVSAHGWLNQIADTTGLTYLNARYYDPVLGRFLSPDPVLNPADPRTLDPYRYADNNPVTYSDASGLTPSCAGDTTGNCGRYAADTVNYASGYTKKQQSQDRYSRTRSNYSPKSSSSPMDAAIDLFYDDTVRISGTSATQNLKGASQEYGGSVVGGMLEGGAGCVADHPNGGACAIGIVTGVMEPVSGATIAGIGVEQLHFWASGGPNDLKVPLIATIAHVKGGDRNLWIQDDGGGRVRLDVFGNVQFGAIYASAGIPESATLAAANSNGAAGNDDPIDNVSIALGYTLFQQYPGGASRQDFHDFFSSSTTRATLAAAGLFEQAG